MNRAKLFDALKALDLKKGLTPEILGGLIFQLWRGSDRTIALVGRSLADDGLQRCMIRRMNHLEPKEIKALFSGFGPLSTFSAKIMTAYATNIIDKEIRDDLDVLREIRNAFAHNYGHISLDTKEIIDICNLFNAPRHGKEALNEIRDIKKDKEICIISFAMCYLSCTKGDNIATYKSSYDFVLWADKIIALNTA